MALNRRIGAQARQQALDELRRMAASNPKVQELYREVLRAAGVAAGVAGAAPRPGSGVSVEVEGRPDLGVGYSSREEPADASM